MAALDEETVFGQRGKLPSVHEIGQNIDALSAPELAERIALLRAEIERLEKAIDCHSAFMGCGADPGAFDGTQPKPNTLTHQHLLAKNDEFQFTERRKRRWTLQRSPRASIPSGRVLFR